jgi:bacillithiol biosynthesis deacetylase BshB1
MSTKTQKLDLLAIAPHPDDAEVWCGGYLAKAVKQKYKVGVLDLTRGELSSNGDLVTRAKETAAASKILGLSYRSNGTIPDGRISSIDEKQLQIVVRKIRETKPTLILSPYFVERHPDHVETSRLVDRAVFFAALRKYGAKLGEAHTVSSLVYYQLRSGFPPTFLVDISEVYQVKLNAIKAFKSQLYSEKGAKTLIADPDTLKAIETRDAFYGSQLGAKYAECYFSRQSIPLTDPIASLVGANPIQFFNA